jgi:peptide/nickel transport system permease protein
MMQCELEAAIVLGLPTMGPLFYESLVNQDIYISGSLLLMYGAMILWAICYRHFQPLIRYSL